MKIIYSEVTPATEEPFVYVLDEEKEILTATYKGETDVFDFSGFPDGEVHYSEIESILEEQPVLSAVRENGTLTVELLQFVIVGEINGEDELEK